MMTASDLAARLEGREIGHEITFQECVAAKEAGLVVVFGASDDCIKLRGAFEDEIFDWSFLVTSAGVFADEPCHCQYFLAAKRRAEHEGTWIQASFGQDPVTDWTFATTMPHRLFHVMEGGHCFCEGLVFAVEDIGREGT